VIMGLFGISEVLANLETHLKQRKMSLKERLADSSHLAGLARFEMGDCQGLIYRIFPRRPPGRRALIASFVSYAVEKKVSKYPEKFGKGAMQGVAGPESANNAASGGPLFHC